ncbi:50S ribosomal protein L30 [Sinimarinibacterium sp. NLF-5-8]|uniref:50S ribosomal protein L30 n=1 Tax=Sinimarinibacterium sp. NLF-5-8 TaxID=2698684 RepID=UPI00137C2F36|nr:50S ribosomal protein L30 [Sinimarinibacterium sp. NLF-5-8]
MKQVKVTLVRSLAKKLQNHQACVRGLGLRRMHQTVVIAATPENMGMVRKASYLLKVEEV